MSLVGFLLFNQHLRLGGAAKTNIVNPAAWANPSAASVSYNSSTDTITFTSAGNGVNISDTPLAALKPSTTYSVSCTKAGSGAVRLKYGSSTGTALLWSGSAVIPVGAPSTTTFTTGAADLGDGKIYLISSNIGVNATVAGLSIIEQ